MPVKPLTQIAGSKIPFFMIEHLFPEEYEPIHRHLSPFLYPYRSIRGRALGSLCQCGENGQCLCYYGIIRHDQIEQFWATENDFRFLGDFLRQN